MSLLASLCALVGLSLLGAVVGCMAVLNAAQNQEGGR